tara:strand:- start:3960 stop:4466 length:507 start_codon:yes stop_codon:yes gene_type:complete
MASYAAPGDLTDRFDATVIKDLVSDTGEPVDDVTGDDKVLAALADASGRVDAALLTGGLYSTDDLEGFTGNNLALLKRITCELAMAYLLGRRQEKYGDDYFRRINKSAEEYLERLRKGERLFGLPASIRAGLPNVDGMTAIEYENLNLLPDRTREFYPHRQTRLPIGR